MSAVTRAGCFLAFEGIEGAGKSTQIELLAERLRTKGFDPLVTREPGGTELGRALRDYLLHQREHRPDVLVEALLMVADRADHVMRVLRPALEAGRVVLCDRYAAATLAYQGGGSGIPEETLQKLNKISTGGLQPDLVFLLDLPVDRAEPRLERRTGPHRDRFESEPRAFFERVRKKYLELARDDPDRWLVLDAQQQVDALAKIIDRRVSQLLSPV